MVAGTWRRCVSLHLRMAVWAVLLASGFQARHPVGESSVCFAPSDDPFLDLP